MKKKKKVNQKETVEVIDNNEKYRVCIDLNATGNARGGRFLDVKGLKETIEELELSGVDKMVGLVYDGTNKLEILTQNIKENLSQRKEKEKGKIDEARLVN
jgi:hypothetical protein|tara:strand:- start:215 stop:517 length:303 start_codon:yes stop_codon:yes gene_type:complete